MASGPMLVDFSIAILSRHDDNRRRLLEMADELSQREQALRRLPLPYSLALRLRDAGISADVICQYVNVELAALDGLYRMAEAKLRAAQNVTDDRYHRAGEAADRTTLRSRVGKPICLIADDLGPFSSGPGNKSGPRPRLGSAAPKPGELQ